MDGTITAVGSEVRDGEETIDARNLVVLPGVIDAHVHFNEPGRADWEGWEASTVVTPPAAAPSLRRRRLPPSIRSLQSRRRNRWWILAYGAVLSLTTSITSRSSTNGG